MTEPFELDDRLLRAALTPSVVEAPLDLRDDIRRGVAATAQRRVLRWPVPIAPPFVVPTRSRVASFATLALLVILAALAAMFIASQRTQPLVLANGLLAYTREGEVWLADPETTDTWNATTSPGFEAVTTWSPDGAWLAMIVDHNWSPENPAFSIDLMRPDGSDRHSITGEGSYFSTKGTLSWSPDGRWIVTEHTTGEQAVDAPARIELVATDGSGPRPIPGLPEPARKPWFSPDGEWIAFFSADGTDDRLFVVRPDGSDLRELYRTDATLGFYSTPEWSPDSRQVLVEAWDRRFDMSLLLVDVDGGRIRDLTPQREPAYGAYFSPDGRHLAFMSGDNACSATLRVIETESRALVAETARAVVIDWAPDGAGMYGLAAAGPGDSPVASAIVGVSIPDGAEPGAGSQATVRPIVDLGEQIGQFNPYCQTPGPNVGGVAWQGVPR